MLILPRLATLFSLLWIEMYSDVGVTPEKQSAGVVLRTWNMTFRRVT